MCVSTKLLEKAFKDLRKNQFIEDAFMIIQKLSSKINDTLDYICKEYSYYNPSCSNCKEEFQKLFMPLKHDNMILFSSFANQYHQVRRETRDHILKNNLNVMNINQQQLNQITEFGLWNDSYFFNVFKYNYASVLIHNEIVESGFSTINRNINLFQNHENQTKQCSRVTINEQFIDDFNEQLFSQFQNEMVKERQRSQKKMKHEKLREEIDAHRRSQEDLNTNN